MLIECPIMDTHYQSRVFNIRAGGVALLICAILTGTVQQLICKIYKLIKI